MDSMAHARQFLLGPQADPDLSAWRRWQLRCGLVLQTHPALECRQASRDDRTITLLGFALAPDAPERSQEQILADLIARAGSLEDVLRAGDALSGRWIIIHEQGERSVLFADATGLRTVVHTLPDCPETWCASQPALIAKHRHWQPDPEALEFWETLGARIPRHIRAWPGASTLYADIHALVPNHYLDLGTREAVRFYPRAPLAPISFEDGTERIAAHLRGSVDAAHRHYPVYQQITAGLDSRCILAASRGHSAATTYFTCVWPSLERSMDGNHRDVRVPRQLLESVGLPHHVYDCPDVPLTAEVAARVATCDSPPLEELGPAAAALPGLVPPAVLVINGNGGEIGRCRLHPTEHPAAISLAELSNFHWTGLGQHPFIRRHLEPWRVETTAACDRTGYRLLDLFYWEQKMSRRVARTFLHLDMAHDTFCPYNSRALLDLYFAVPEQHRRPGGGHQLQHAVIRRLWPEVLASDINPESKQERLTRLVRRLRRRARGLGLPV